tara:strand:+ start:196 stop:345 length:150 start_codon:yes stop_codon:yes gene_type:complete
MWRFYHQVTQTADAAASQIQIGEGGLFFMMGLLTALVVLAPSYFERKNK